MKPSSLFLIAALVVTLAVALKETRSAPQEPPTANKWAHVQIVSYPAGLTGIFDTSDGKLYFYASDVKTPFMVTQLEALGEPLKVIKAPPGQ